MHHTTDITTPPHQSRSNSIRSRKHSAPVPIHALLRTSTDSGVKHCRCHRRGASLSASATVSPTPVVDRATVNSSPPANGKVGNKPDTTKSKLDEAGLDKDGNTPRPASSESSPNPDITPAPSQTRQRSHSYASAPLSTLLTHLDSSSLASFTPADVYPCAAGSLRRCQWLLKANAYRDWYHDDDDDDAENDEDVNCVQVFNEMNPLKSPSHILPPSVTSPSPPLRKKQLRRVLPSRLWKTFPSPNGREGYPKHKRSGSASDPESELNSDADADADTDTDRESDSDGVNDTPSLSPRSSRQSSRSRSSTSQSSSNLLPIPSITRRHSGLGEGSLDKPLSSSVVVAVAAGSGADVAETAPVPVHAPSTSVAVRRQSDAKMAMALPAAGSGSFKSRQDPGTASTKYKNTVPSLSVRTKNLPTTMQTATERHPSACTTPSLLSPPSPPPSRALRSSKHRQSISSHAVTASALPNEASIRVPFPTPPNTSLNVVNPTSPESKPLLTLSDLERTSKLMRSTTTCAVCGRSGSDFPRCPRTGATWCSRACRVAAKKS